MKSRCFSWLSCDGKRWLKTDSDGDIDLEGFKNTVCGISALRCIPDGNGHFEIGWTTVNNGRI